MNFIFVTCTGVMEPHRMHIIIRPHCMHSVHKIQAYWYTETVLLLLLSDIIWHY